MRLKRLSSFLAPIRLPYLLLAVIILGAIFFALTYLGIHSARQSLLKILVDEGKALSESLTLSSNNAIQAKLLLESLSEQQFLDIAETAQNRFTDGADPDDFRAFANEFDLISIDLLTPDLVIIGSDRWAAGYSPVYPSEVELELHDILALGGGYRSTLVVTDDSPVPLVQYFIYVEATEGNLIILAAEAVYMDQIMKEIGIGYLIQRISEQTGIAYILLQSREGIVFSSRPIAPIPSIESDLFLDSLMAVDTIGWRLHMFEGQEVLEIARRFESVSYPPGVYRIGMNLDDFHEISAGYDRQIIIIAVILFLLTLLVVAVISINQNYFILDQSFRRMRSLAETISDRLTSAILAYDSDGKIIGVNAALTKLTGLNAEHIGKHIVDVGERLPFPLPPSIPSNERTVSQERVIVNPEGERMTVLLGMASLPEDAGGGVVVLIHDITEQKRLEEQNRRQERLSEMGDMAAGVAHEIRNPLNAIAIASQRLKMEFEPKEERDEYDHMAQTILDETGRLNQILTRFLDLAKTRGAEDRPIELSTAVAKGIDSIKSEAARQNVKIIVNGNSQVKVRAAVDKLQQVFINLIKNGIQAMPEGGSVTITVEPPVDNTVKIIVADTGSGFPLDVMSKIFQPYFTTKTDGSGLGLALAYKTITDYGGSIEASNNPSGGARIEITLPIA